MRLLVLALSAALCACRTCECPAREAPRFEMNFSTATATPFGGWLTPTAYRGFAR